MLKILKTIGTFFVILAMISTANAQEKPIDLDVLKGQPLKSYPKLMMIEKLGLVNVFWSNDINCQQEPSKCAANVDQRAALIVQRKIETDVLAKLKNFEAAAEQAIPNWKSEIAPKLFPLTLRIELAQETMSAGSNFGKTTVEIFTEQNSSLGQVAVGSSISVGILEGGNFESLDTLVLHEFGHMMLRALGFPQLQDPKNGRIDSLVEETIPDLVSSITNSGTPYIAPGLQDIARKFAQDGLKNPKNDNFQKALMEGHLQGISDKAMRDFSMRYSYPDTYLLPGHYVSSLHINGIIYQLRQVVPSAQLLTVLLKTIATHPSDLLDGEAYVVVGKILARYAELFPADYQQSSIKIQNILRENGWIKAAKTEQVMTFNSFIDQEGAENVRIRPDASLMSSLFPATMRCLTYTIKAGGKTRFAFTQFVDWSMQQRLKLVPANSCDQASLFCVCGADKQTITLDSIYIDRDKRVLRTNAFPISSDKLNSSCYTLSFEWE